jgi:hypothetical protein
MDNNSDIMQIKSQKKYRMFLILLLYVVVALIGIRYGVHPEVRAYDFINAIVLALVFTQLCIVDSRIAGKPLSIFSYWLVFIFYGIAVPICVVRAHGTKGLLIIIAHLFGLLVVLVMFSFITLLLFEKFLSGSI